MNMPDNSRRFVVIFIVGALLPLFCCAQYDTVSKFRLPIEMDSFVVRSGFDINAFIRRMRNDTSFYKAFKNMRLVPYSAYNSIDVYGKSGTVVASLHSKTKQRIKNHCRQTEVVEQHTTGDFYKRNGDYRYYTAELYDHLFWAKDSVCNENDIVAGAMDERGRGQLEKSTYQLKRLIFDPGSKVSGVPFMGEHQSIFEEDEARKYDFKVQRDVYEGQECFVFRITPKAGYEHRTLYNELTTWFRGGDYSIIARNYWLSYNTLLYDFDVKMKVRTRQVGSKLYPTRIDYDGNWFVVTKKRERVMFFF
jgi:hypothetical protein